MTTIRRWTCGLWRYLRGLGYRHPEHRRPRRDRDDPYLPAEADYLTAPIAAVTVIDRDAASDAIAYWSRQAWEAINAEPPQIAELPDPGEEWPDAAAVDRWLAAGRLAVAWWIPPGLARRQLVAA